MVDLVDACNALVLGALPGFTLQGFDFTAAFGQQESKMHPFALGHGRRRFARE